MLRKIIDYVKSDEFQINIDANYIDVINYTNINYMEEEKISIDYLKGTIKIKGTNLSVIKLLDNEVLIKGNYDDITFKRNK